MRRAICGFLVILLIFSVNLTVFAVDSRAAVDDCLAKILNADRLGPGDEWAVIALARSYANVDRAVFDEYLSALRVYLYEHEGVLSRNKYTEYARVSLALAALGQNPRNFENFDILLPLYDYDAVLKQGINGPIWALLALDFAGIPQAGSGEMGIREKYIDYILEQALPSGGFALSGANYDVDVTAMAATALFRYGGKAGEAAEKAAQMLANARVDGFYLSLGRPTCESAAQAVIALCSLGAQKNAIDAALQTLMKFHIAGEGFCHEPGGGADTIASVQAALALTAFERYESGAPFLFDMSGKSVFFDISEISAGGKAVYALVNRGILQCFGDGSFAPQGNLTRAQLATIFTKSLGLEGGSAGFSDVPEGAWYAPYVDAAAANGLIFGRGDGVFDPEANVTRQECSIMLGRAYDFLGLEAPALSEDKSPLTRVECAEFIYDLLVKAGEIVQ